MLHYKVPKRFREQAAAHDREIQAAIAVLANRKLGIEATPQGIYRFEGGVVVNGHEVTIKDGFVTDSRPSNVASPEETAAVDAIKEVANLWRSGGIKAVREKAGPAKITIGGPLRSMFSLD